MKPQEIANPYAKDSFADRIKLLIQRVGSATEIARMCGFSEGVVRSWRDGNTDPSRARCVKLASALGISLMWLVAGEGPLQADPMQPSVDEQYSSEKAGRDQAPTSTFHAEGHAVDSRRLNAAMRILQSELNLAGSEASLAENTDLLTELYDILGPGGSHVDPLAMVTFNYRLAERIRAKRVTA